ncbi:MAG: sigma factor [Planctomycetota bacterium]
MTHQPLPCAEDLLLSEGRFLRALARRLVSDTHLADDIVQDTWVATLHLPEGYCVDTFRFTEIDGRKVDCLHAWVHAITPANRVYEPVLSGWDEVFPRSQALPPGAYVVEIMGIHGARVQDMPWNSFHRFEIRAGEETRIEIPLLSGQRRKIRFLDPPGALPVRSGLFTEIRNAAGEVIGGTRRAAMRGRPIELELELDPGIYELYAYSRWVEATVTLDFTGEVPPDQVIEVQLR